MLDFAAAALNTTVTVMETAGLKGVNGDGSD